MTSLRTDVVVVGAGNAALAAALRAAELGARVLVLEAAPESAFGGNSSHSGANFRIAFEHVDDLAPLEIEMTPAVREMLAAHPYPRARLLRELTAASRGRADEQLLRLLVDKTPGACAWLRRHGLSWAAGTKGKLVDRIDDWHLSPVFSIIGKGPALVAGLRAAVARAGVEVRCSAAAREICLDKSGAVAGLRVRTPEGFIDVESSRIILACGGFEANQEMRVRYLGPQFASVKLRGTRYNTGDGLTMALAIGAQPGGHWAGAHICPIDQRSPDFSTIDIGEDSRRCRYGFGILVNRHARRFLDEAADQPWVTYAWVGNEVQRQEGSVAYEIADARTAHVVWENELYDTTETIEANTIAELAQRIGISPPALEAEIARFNAAIQTDAEFRPDRLDGRSTTGARPEKSNWALPIDTPPFRACPITAGLTFTYAGLEIDTECRVLDRAGGPIAGLYAAGQMAGGFFFEKYMGATGLARGLVTGITAAEALTR
jgi:tricarballylate dehydrogenase